MSVELVEDLKKKTVPQLKAYAKKNNIDLFGVSTKVEILEVIFSFIPRPEQAMKKKDQPAERVALYSEKNLHWNGVGDLERGYNIVSKEDSEKWLFRKDVRIATPDEVAKFYGKNKK
ncbi:MAG: hypothetical protein FJ356_00670 [Thaumarchaeota archaeon]|nr:hypothetical protein [Nitrososphaerota archaeon]